MPRLKFVSLFDGNRRGAAGTAGEVDQESALRCGDQAKLPARKAGLGITGASEGAAMFRICRGRDGLPQNRAQRNRWLTLSVIRLGTETGTAAKTGENGVGADGEKVSQAHYSTLFLRRDYHYKLLNFALMPTSSPCADFRQSRRMPRNYALTLSSRCESFKRLQ